MLFDDEFYFGYLNVFGHCYYDWHLVSYIDGVMKFRKGWSRVLPDDRVVVCWQGS